MSPKCATLLLSLNFNLLSYNENLVHTLNIGGRFYTEGIQYLKQQHSFKILAFKVGAELCLFQFPHLDFCNSGE